MSNPYYNHGTYPVTGSSGSSAAMRAELSAISAGFDLLPTLSGNGGKYVLVNAAGSAMTVSGLVSESGSTLTVSAPTLTWSGNPTHSGNHTWSGTTTLSALSASQAVFTDASKNLVSNAITGTGNVVMSTSPTLVTPVLGAATATSLNGLTVSSTTGTLTLANGSTLATSGANALTLTTTGATNVTLPTSGTLATTAGTVASFSAGSTGFTPSTATTGAVTLAGTLATTNGGTGLTSFTANGVVYASSTSALTTGSALTFDGTNFAVGVASPLGKLHVSDSAVFGASAINQLVAQQTSVGGSAALALRSLFTNANNTNKEIATLELGIVTDGTASPSAAIAFKTISGGTLSEQMRLTSTGLGIGTSSPSYKLDVQGNGSFTSGASTTNVFVGSAAGNGGATVRFLGSNTQKNWMIGNQFNVNGGLEFTLSTTTGGSTFTTPSMVIDSSGNLGIGTSSPGFKLDVVGALNLQGSSTFPTTGMFLRSADNQLKIIGGSAGISFAAQSGASTYALLDSSGNLGLGVTPSAWFSTIRALQIGSVGGASIAGNTSAGGSATIGLNVYFDAAAATARYGASSFASRYTQLNGAHEWYTAPSGTAGNAISFTQAMTLSASNPALLVGTTSDVQGFNFQAKNQVGFSVHNSADNATAAYFSAANNVALTSAGSSAVVNGVDGILLGVNATERARISSDGTFRVKGAGTAGSTDAFQVSGSAPADAARITSGGDLLVGTTSQTLGTARLCVSSSGLTTVSTTSTSAESPYASFNTATSGNNQFMWFYTGDSGQTFRGSIEYNRGTGLVAYNTTSDYRAKDILGPVANPGATIDALKVYEGQMKGATQSRPMLVAHEAQAVAPYSVTGEKDEVNEDGTPKFQQMDVSSLVPLLIAEIQSLRARVAALES